LVFGFYALSDTALEVHAAEEGRYDGAQDHHHKERGDKRGSFFVGADFHGSLDRMNRISGIYCSD
jgi:hypothetical protein